MILDNTSPNSNSKLNKILSNQDIHTEKLDKLKIDIENNSGNAVPIGESTKLTIASADKTLHLTGLTGSNYLSVDKWGVWISETVDVMNGYPSSSTNVYLRKYDSDLNLIGRIRLGNSTAIYFGNVLAGLEEYNRYMIYYCSTGGTWPTFYFYCLDKETLNITQIHSGSSVSNFSIPYSQPSVTYSNGTFYYISSSSVSNGTATAQINKWEKGTSTVIASPSVSTTITNIPTTYYSYSSPNNPGYDGTYIYFSPYAKIDLNNKTLITDNKFLNSSVSYWACNNGHITLFNSFFETKSWNSTEYTKAEANLSENTIYGIYNFENSIVGRNCDYNGVGILDKYDYDLNLKKSVKILNFPKANLMYQSANSNTYRMHFFTEDYIYLIISNNIFRVPW